MTDTTHKPFVNAIKAATESYDRAVIDGQDENRASVAYVREVRAVFNTVGFSLVYSAKCPIHPAHGSWGRQVGYLDEISDDLMRTAALNGIVKTLVDCGANVPKEVKAKGANAANEWRRDQATKRWKSMKKGDWTIRERGLSAEDKAKAATWAEATGKTFAKQSDMWAAFEQADPVDREDVIEAYEELEQAKQKAIAALQAKFKLRREAKQAA